MTVDDLLDRCEASVREIESAIARGDWERLEHITVELPDVVPELEASPEIRARFAQLLDDTLGLVALAARRRAEVSADLNRSARYRKASRTYLQGG